MKLRTKGSIHRISGSGMAFHHFDDVIEHDALLSRIGDERVFSIPDSFLTIEEVGDDFCRFTFRFFDRRDEYALRVGENVSNKNEGNAFGYNVEFILE